MAVEIPLRSDLTDFDLQCSLDGTIYTLRFRWNPRDACWYLDVTDEDGSTNIAMGVKFVIDMPLGYKARANGNLWPGVLLAVDTTKEHADPGIGDLGTRIILLYFTAAELPVNTNAPITSP